MLNILRENPNYNDIIVVNNAFSFNKRHAFLHSVLMNIGESFDPSCWACIGGKVLTKIVRKLSNSTLIKNIPESADLKIVPERRFIPIYWKQVANKLWPVEPASFEKWKTMFENSSAIHMNYQLTNNIAVPDDPQHCAYALFGPMLCPLSYFSTENF